jgi:DNA-binding Lrp family transcriptional regulator
MAVMLGYILIRTMMGKENDVLELLSNFKNIVKSHAIYGEWDIIASVEYQKLPELNTLVMNIRAIPGVSQTSTLVVM